MAGELYANNLNQNQIKNVAILLARMNANGITNPISQAGILAVMSKESGFNLTGRETSYSTTSVARIKSIPQFARALAGFSDAQIDALKKDDVKFFNTVYNGIAGNGPNDGYKFRGGGPNQITGRSNYQSLGRKIGVNLGDNPEKIEDPYVAADAAIQYFKDGFNSLKAHGNDKPFNSPPSINDFKTAQDSSSAMYNINAGPGFSFDKLKNSKFNEGLTKTNNVVQSYYDYITKNPQVAQIVQQEEKLAESNSDIQGEKKKYLAPIVIVSAIVILSAILIFRKNKK